MSWWQRLVRKWPSKPDTIEHKQRIKKLEDQLSERRSKLFYPQLFHIQKVGTELDQLIEETLAIPHGGNKK